MRRLAALLAVTAACASGNAARDPVAPPPRRLAAASQAWWNGAVVYEVYVRSFRDSDADGHGDLRGLVEKLDYLNDGDPATEDDLGIDAIWLMPIHPSPSLHGYDVTDYDGVNPAYGTAADFDRLVGECHRRGIRVVLDFVVNHSSDRHPWFVDARSSPLAAHRSWYVWAPSDQGWQRPWGPGRTWYEDSGAWYYALFWSGMPDLDWREPAMRAELAAAAGRWLARGVDGFRLDAVRYLVEDGGGQGQQDRPGTHAALRDFVGGIRAVRPDALVVGEAWADTATIATYYGSTGMDPAGDELPLTFDFPLAEAIVEGIVGGSATPVARSLHAATSAYPAGVADAPFLSNHDQVRAATRLGADPAAQRLAAGILLTLPGTPFVYYGEELGLPNGTCPGDECKRAPMAWDGSRGAGFTSGTPWQPLAPSGPGANVAAQRADPGSVLSAYRTLIRLRRESAALRRGDLQLLQDPSAALPTLAYTRSAPGETVLVVHNLGGSFTSAGPFAAPGRSAVPLLAPTSASLGGAGGAWSATVPPRATAVWRLDP
jgi:glycosidase